MSARNPWHARAEELADWALARFFVRRDRYGGYYAEDGVTRKCAKPKDRTPNAVTRSTLLRHFRATRTEDVVGAYLLSAEPSVGRAVAVDIDAHDATADPEANARYGVRVYAQLAGLGFRPLLARWGGSCHAYALLAADQPGAALYAFGKALVAGTAVESYPKQVSTRRADGTDGYGNWLRVVGRHHTRPEWAQVWDGAAWLEGAAAVAHVLSLTGDEVILSVPEPDPEPLVVGAEPVSVIPKNIPRSNARPDELDVLSEYSRSVTLDEVCGWHERAGHAATRRGATRVEFRRAGKGKGGGDSFNVEVRGGIPVTYNFSPNAGLPDGKGLSPAQVRCFYESGACDPAALCRFADGLRAALGLPPRRRAAPGPAPPEGSSDERIAVLEAQVRELAAAVVDLQDQLSRAAYRVRN
jgi:putative DNA primase/helicase